MLGLLAQEDQPWRRQAECGRRWLDPTLFLPVDRAAVLPEAAAACAACAVRIDCLMFALERDTKGTWGGLSERERDEIKRHAPDWRAALREMRVAAGA